ncbi:MAG: hypothetical protein ACTH2Q_01515 [Propionibacteriaceae bacterium]
MVLNRKKSPELQALLEKQAENDRLIKEAEQAQEAKEAVAVQAAKRNGAAYAGVLLDLCETLAIEPEHPRIRKGPKGKGSVEVPTDPDHELFLTRVNDILEKIIAAADKDLLAELRLADNRARDQRRDEREKSRRSAKDRVEPAIAAPETHDSDSTEADVAAEFTPMSVH